MASTAVLFAVVAIGSLAGCAAEEEPITTRHIQFPEFDDQTHSDYYSVTAVDVTSDYISDRATLTFSISNANHTKFSPVIGFSLSDGSEIICTAGDPRRVPSLEETTTDWDFECDGRFPEDTSGTTVLVTDEYE